MRLQLCQPFLEIPWGSTTAVPHLDASDLQLPLLSEHRNKTSLEGRSMDMARSINSKE